MVEALRSLQGPGPEPPVGDGDGTGFGPAPGGGSTGQLRSQVEKCVLCGRHSVRPTVYRAARGWSSSEVMPRDASALGPAAWPVPVVSTAAEPAETERILRASAFGEGTHAPRAGS